MHVVTFRIAAAAPVPFAALPLVAFTVEATNGDRDRHVQSGLLRCQIQIDAAARSYDAEEARGLRDLFGEGPVWGRAVRRLLWTQATAIVPAFSDRCTFDVHAPCPYDLAIGSASYLRALPRGEVPIAILFSGTLFSSAPGGGLEASPVPWTSEARFAMPVSVWQETVDHHYAGSAPLSLSRDLLERLSQYRTRAGVATLEQAVDHLLRTGDGGRS
jgi:hypothetical protein